ncbi:DUF4870 domain-containing protein [Kurthia sibirica]|uniref:DUF4870 domain-containing protein n=1 Tax=Kurthia sibirica TaxID=202750 RepID=A0A2U3AL67_9BACL|nr:DUF4870 domain-containing protein [Kurthia sibirica]PWI25280.1 hypothetical protein DEX24_09160 [Kurthia sibirica]GEK34663.1 membrane protein [Kurthia sibirica]
MSNNRIIASLCYFSIFFAGIILPLIVWLIVPEKDVKKHAKAAFFSHLIMYIPIIIAVIIAIFASFAQTDDVMVNSNYSISVIITLLVTAVVVGIVFIWNIYRGIKVLTSKEVL